VAVVDRVRLPALLVHVAHARVPAHTFLTYAGAHQLTLCTALPSLGLELHSSYLGHPDAPETIASHLQLAPDQTPLAWAESHFAGALPVAHDRRRCLYDHALELQRLVGDTRGGEIRVELPDAALELVDTA
jgi:hypothetical protein